MKGIIADICVYVLRKFKRSVIIGYEVHGEMQARYDDALIYDNYLDVEYYLSDGNKFDVPVGKFIYEKESE